jgi:HEAT repeat protein
MQAIKAVCTAMKDSNRDVRLRAVDMIQYLVNAGDELAIGAVGSCLEDPDQKVREAASQILPKLSNEFDEKLVNEALQRLKSMHSVVRKTAVKTLVSVHTKGAPVVIDGLIKAAQDFDGDVKILAITELAKQAGRGHDGALQAVVEQLDDLRPRIREAATKALAVMATKAQRQAISKLVRALHDQATDVYGHRSIMAHALISIREISAADRSEDFSPRIREEISTRIQEFLNSPDWCVRKEAIATLVKTAPQSNRKDVLETLVGKLEDGKIEVRMQAMECLEAFTDGLDKWVISGIACRLVSTSRDVRNAAATTLSKLLDAKVNATNADILQRITQGKIPTNSEVIGLLSQIMTRGDEGYLDGFLKCMRHDAPSIRRLASDAIQIICIPGQSCVVEDIIKNLKHESPSVKCDSMRTLSMIVLKNDDRAVQIVQDMLSDPDVEVKKMVSIALKNMLAEGDSRRTIALSCVQLDSGYHNDAERKGALEQLGQLAYASSKFQLDGWSVEDADMERFWQQIRLPRGPSNDSEKFVPKILKSLKDEGAWVRRAGVDAIMHCAKKGDPEVVAAVCHLLHDSSFAIRMAAVSALSVCEFLLCLVLMPLQTEILFPMLSSRYFEARKRLELTPDMAGSVKPW